MKMIFDLGNKKAWHQPRVVISNCLLVKVKAVLLEKKILKYHQITIFLLISG
jgi:hypothetical protein